MKGEKVRLAFERLHYTVPVKGSTPKLLLQDIKGEVTSGHVLAILGPSGAGKTTLLNMLTLQQNGGTPTGFINVNGEPLTPALYDRTCAYVEQTDTLWASLTVREHLAYAASAPTWTRPRGAPCRSGAVGLRFHGHARGQRIGAACPAATSAVCPWRLRPAPEHPVPDEPTSGWIPPAVRMMSFCEPSR